MNKNIRKIKTLDSIHAVDGREGVAAKDLLLQRMKRRELERRVPASEPEPVILDEQIDGRRRQKRPCRCRHPEG